jgi:hypothetical protein
VIRTTITRAALAVSLILGVAHAQESRPAPPAALRTAVEAYLGECAEAAAAKLLDALVARPDATPEAVLAAIVASDAPLAKSMTLLVPHKSQLLETTIEMPESHVRYGHAGPRIPVVFDIAKGDFASWVKYDAAVVAYVKGYTPPEFSDEGRDAFLKVLRRVAHLSHGDPDRLWLSGFSWAAHASWDVSLHRPGVVRGICTGGGGPRLAWFRLLSQLGQERVRSFCGMKDDQKLIWNLREVERPATGLKLDYKLVLDPERAHEMPLKGTEAIPSFVQETPALAPNPWFAASGTLLADAPLVECPLFRIDQVDEARVTAKPIPVSPTASEDEQRRTTLRAWATKVARLGWNIEGKKDETTVTLTGAGVGAATVFLREPAFHPGSKVTVRAGSQPAWSGALVPDPRTMLSEARRTGERLRPALRAVEVRFQ